MSAVSVTEHKNGNTISVKTDVIETPSEEGRQYPSNLRKKVWDPSLTSNYHQEVSRSKRPRQGQATRSTMSQPSTNDTSEQHSSPLPLQSENSAYPPAVTTSPVNLPATSHLGKRRRDPISGSNNDLEIVEILDSSPTLKKTRYGSSSKTSPLNFQGLPPQRGLQPNGNARLLQQRQPPFDPRVHFNGEDPHPVQRSRQPTTTKCLGSDQLTNPYRTPVRASGIGPQNGRTLLNRNQVLQLKIAEAHWKRNSLSHDKGLARPEAKPQNNRPLIPPSQVQARHSPTRSQEGRRLTAHNRSITRRSEIQPMNARIDVVSSQEVPRQVADVVQNSNRLPQDQMPAQHWVQTQNSESRSSSCLPPLPEQEFYGFRRATNRVPAQPQPGTTVQQPSRSNRQQPRNIKPPPSMSSVLPGGYHNPPVASMQQTGGPPQNSNMSMGSGFNLNPNGMASNPHANIGLSAPSHDNDPGLSHKRDWASAIGDAPIYGDSAHRQKKQRIGQASNLGANGSSSIAASRRPSGFPTSSGSAQSRQRSFDTSLYEVSQPQEHSLAAPSSRADKLGAQTAEALDGASLVRGSVESPIIVDDFEPYTPSVPQRSPAVGLSCPQSEESQNEKSESTQTAMEDGPALNPLQEKPNTVSTSTKSLPESNEVEVSKKSAEAVVEDWNNDKPYDDDNIDEWMAQQLGDDAEDDTVPNTEGGHNQDTDPSSASAAPLPQPIYTSFRHRRPETMQDKENIANAIEHTYQDLRNKLEGEYNADRLSKGKYDNLRWDTATETYGVQVSRLDKIWVDHQLKDVFSSGVKTKRKSKIMKAAERQLTHLYEVEGPWDNGFHDWKAIDPPLVPRTGKPCAPLQGQP